MNSKDIIIKSRSGLYLVIRQDGTIGMTNLRHATHFEESAKAKRAMRRSGYVDLKFDDLNKKER